LLSGPEPQRSIFEEILLPQLAQFNGKAVLVRGLPAEKNMISAPAHVEIYNHLPSGELNKLISESDFIISRSGYSTIMDLVKLAGKSILVPTPGQTEQEYLAARLSRNKIAFSVEQHNFSLQEALAGARQFPFTPFEYNNPTLLSSAIAGLMKIIA
jgi:UDP-N-acetylglucosamine:LPS N-acetylglucosamine transferase